VSTSALSAHSTVSAVSALATFTALIALTSSASAAGGRSAAVNVEAQGRANVPVELAAPKREAADTLFYTRLGGSALPGKSLLGGPDLGLGVRLELSHIGIDASMNFGVTQTGPRMSVTGVRGSWLKLTTHYHFMPEADATPYIGGGLSWGGRSEEINGTKFGGTGLQGEIVAGYEFMRSSTVRIFVQADATMPFYLATSDAAARPALRTKAGDTGAASTQYLPTLGLSFGLAFGKAHVIGVAKVE